MTRSMSGKLVASAALLAVLVAGSAFSGDRLVHRVWLLRGVPPENSLAALRSGGVDGVVLPVGELAVGKDSCRLTLVPLPDLKPLAGWSVTPLVWVAGEGEASGNATTFANELAPVLRLLTGSTSLVLAARAAWPGLVPLAGAVAERTGASVGVLVAAPSASTLTTHAMPPGTELVVAAFGNPPALGFPASTIADDLAALAAVDDAGVRYRVAIVVAPLATPPPGAGGASLATVTLPTVADYRPADRGDEFVLRQPVDWGGVQLAARDSVRVEVVDTARYHRDLGLVLRGVRPGLVGWDTAGLPDREPALGMSLEAFLDYLQGGRPYPSPKIEADWATPTRLRLAVANPTPQASAVASTGNWLELRFTGAALLDLALGDFSGAEYGRVEAGVWRRAVAREASAVRLFMTCLPPQARLSGAVVTFLARPTAVSAGWVLRLGDGTEVSGASDAPSLRKP